MATAHLRQPQGKGCVFALCLSPDEKQVYAGSEGGVISIWDTEIFQGPRYLAPITPSIDSLVISGDGMWIAGKTSKGTALWNTQNGTLKWRPGEFGEATCLDFHPDGRSILMAERGLVKQRDCESGKILKEYRDPQGSVNALTVLPDGRHFITGSADGTGRVWALDGKGPIESTLFHTKAVSFFATHPGDDWILSGSPDRTIRIWRPRAP